MNEAGGTRESFDSVWGPYLAIAIAVAVLVLGTMLWVVLRYRVRGEDHGPAGDRPVWMKRLEAGWIVLVAAIVAVLLTLTFRSQEKISALGSDPPAATIDVTAFQWGWRFDYGSGVSVIGNARRIPTLVVPEGELVRFTLTSRDVIHSFWIPEERFKRDAFPSRETHFGLVFDGAGSTGRCAEFCGLDHYRMDFHVAAARARRIRRLAASQGRGGRLVNAVPGQLRRVPPVLPDAILSTDHKRTAAKLGGLAFGLFALAGIFALLMRSELAEPGLQIVSSGTYDQLFTMHGSLMIYFVMTPLALALGLYFVPLQIGAADVAAPRLASFGFWLIAGGATTMLTGFLTDSGAGRAGWTAYLPLSGGQASPGRAWTCG